MSVRIAIPEPSSDPEYNHRSLSPYLDCLRDVGADSVMISLSTPPAEIAHALSSVHGVLLPGSRYDVEPERYGEERIPECGPSDPARTAVDELLLQDAFNLRKPILAICHGAQTMNVWRNGSLIQDLKTSVNHSPGRDVVNAHTVALAEGSRLRTLADGLAEVEINSSHHQAVQVAGDNLRITAVSPIDGVIEAVELDDQRHFVIGVQWHPERTCRESALSRNIFVAFVQAAADWRAISIAEMTVHA